MRTPWQLAYEMKRRDVHIRKYIDGRRFEVFIDKAFHSWWMTEDECEAAIRTALNITHHEAGELEAELARELSTIMPRMKAES